jgi:superfamily II DNA or RNA helicase
MNPGIFTNHLLSHGTWQEFERNTARLLLHSGWKSVHVIGRSGDGGADVIAIKPNGQVWVFQCKFSSRAGVGVDAIDEIRNAGKLYRADGLCVVTSQSPSQSFSREVKRLKNQGLSIEHLGPQDLRSMESRANLESSDRISLREYQCEAVENVRTSLLETGKAQLIMATGLGKTVVMSEVVNDLLADELLGDGRVLILAHTVPLVNQLLRSFWKQLTKHVPTHRWAAGETPTNFDGLTFATIQTLYNAAHFPSFDLIVVDEAHHLGAHDYSKVIERLDSPRILGATATPWRADGVSINNWIGSPNFEMGIKDGLERGFLSNVDYRILADNINWEIVRDSSKHGYSIGQLNKRLLIPSRDEKAVRHIYKVFTQEGRRRGIVFSPSKHHARHFASELRRHSIRADSLTSDDSHIERFQKIGKFSAGGLDILCTVDIFNEGIDVPDVDLIAFLRVTHSRRIFVQQLGRGLRIGTNKTNVIVLDFAADIRRIHAAIDLSKAHDGEIENLFLHNSVVTFSDQSLGRFFYEWIADMGNLQDLDEDDVVRLPILDPGQFNFPEVLP